VGQVHVTPLMFVAMLAVPGLAAAAPLGRGDFLPRHPVQAVATLIVAQLALHAVIGAAPMAFGLAIHGQRPVFTAVAIGVHLVIALQLGLLLWVADRVLARAVRVVVRLRALLAAGTPAGAATPYIRIVDLQVGMVLRLWRAHRGRGPPRGATAESHHALGAALHVC
jgi:hypothetical protein